MSSDDGTVDAPSRVDARSCGSDESEQIDGSRAGTPDEWPAGMIHPEAVDREFGWRGWVLVGITLLTFVVAPVGIWLVPPDAGSYRFALIILPLVPALVLAVTAVWATTRP